MELSDKLVETIDLMSETLGVKQITDSKAVPDAIRLREIVVDDKSAFLDSPAGWGMNVQVELNSILDGELPDLRPVSRGEVIGILKF